MNKMIQDKTAEIKGRAIRKLYNNGLKLSRLTVKHTCNYENI